MLVAREFWLIVGIGKRETDILPWNLNKICCSLYILKLVRKELSFLTCRSCKNGQSGHDSPLQHVLPCKSVPEVVEFSSLCLMKVTHCARKKLHDYKSSFSKDEVRKSKATSFGKLIWIKAYLVLFYSVCISVNNLFLNP